MASCVEIEKNETFILLSFRLNLFSKVTKFFHHSSSKEYMRIKNLFIDNKEIKIKNLHLSVGENRHISFKTKYKFGEFYG